MPNVADPISPRLERLVRFLDQDPQNTALLEDAVSAAIDEHQFNMAADLISRQAAGALTPALLNLKGIAALAGQNFETAIEAFENLRNQGVNDPAILFNLAWARAMTGDFAAANDLLDDEVVAVSSRAAALKIEAMHHLELFGDALSVGQGLAERFPDNHELMGALATLAMDSGDVELSRHYAERSGDNPQGQAALGMLLLDEQDPVASVKLFDQIIARQPANPRAWIGKGLGLLSNGDPIAGAAAIDHGAALFEDHLGSWIASGWAHFVGGNIDKARTSFEHALSLDANFAESHGGLAVLDAMDGKIESAEQRCKVALRLDRNCLGAALARVVLLDRQGRSADAAKIREMAMSTPIGVNGKTLTQAIASMAIGRKSDRLS